MPKITPNVLFETEALVAAEFYVGLFPNSKIGNVSYCGEAGPLPVGTALAVDFVLDGEDFTSINCGVAFTFSESFSLRIVCHGQEEVDHYWNALTAGGSEGRCGWLKDCFGVSWQVTPVEMGRYLGHEDPAKSSLAMQAMMKMSKIDLSEFEEAIR